MIKNLVEQYPELCLDELRDWITYLTGEEYSIPTLSKYLRGIGLTVKKVRSIICFFCSLDKCDQTYGLFLQLQLIAKLRDELCNFTI